MLSLDLDALDFAKGGGLVTIVVQHARTGVVLMVAGADREALECTLSTGEMHFRSRTRGLWRKGETSGNTQRVITLTADCDRDAVLARVLPAGPACHTGTESCFDSADTTDGTVARLDATIDERARDGSSGTTTASTSYTQRLLRDRNLRLKKLGEEAAELIAACADGDRDRAVEEAADLVYHTLVALRALGAGLQEVAATLEQRRR